MHWTTGILPTKKSNSIFGLCVLTGFCLTRPLPVTQAVSRQLAKVGEKIKMDILSELVKFLQEVSPLVWQSLIKQVYVEAVGFLMWGIGLAAICPPVARWAKARLEDDDTDIPAVLAFICIVIAVLVSLMLLTSAIQHFINPEFYAIRFIVSSVGGG